MYAKFILIPILLIGACAGQNEVRPVLDSLINSIFDTDAGLPETMTNANTKTIFDTSSGLPESSASKKSPPFLQTESSRSPCGYGKKCVPNYLCQDGATLMDDDVDDRSGPCPFLHKCCNTGDRVADLNIPISSYHKGCGLRNTNILEFKIKETTDNEAEFGELPWMVAIMETTIIADIPQNFVRIYKCGGSLIAPKLVLTAAHCVYDKLAYDLMARAGEWEPYSSDEPFSHQDIQVQEIITHEHFNNRSLYNDIALLVLEATFNKAPHINTICLPPSAANFDLSHCFASGWGKNHLQNGKYANTLKKIDLPVVPNAKCQQDFRKTIAGNNFKLHQSFMCAGGEGSKDTCMGDGGSPFVCPMATNPNRYFQIGIVSWGIGCGEENVPGVYASIPQLRSWIDDQVANKGIVAEFFTP